MSQILVVDVEQRICRFVTRAFEANGFQIQAAVNGYDALRLVDISNNIGDSRSLMTHPASTTHSGLSEEVRLEMGIDEGMLRLSVGLEDPEDVIEDFDQALRAVGL